MADDSIKTAAPEGGVATSDALPLRAQKAVQHRLLAKGAIRVAVAEREDRVLRDGPALDRVGPVKAVAAGSLSVARKFASSVSRRSTRSTTRTFVCYRASFPRQGRLFPDV